MFTSDTGALAPMIRKLASRSALGAAEIEALGRLPCRLATGNRGSYLIREGDRTDTCVVLLSGFAYRSRISGYGGRQITAVQLRGDLIGLHGDLLDAADHSVQALTRIDMAHIPQQSMLDIATQYPAIARALWRDVLVDGSVSREWLLSVGQRDARQRIAHLFCEMVVRQEAAGIGAGPRYDWPMTQEQLGEATGMTAVHVNRTVQSLRADGLIDTARHSLTIIDWPGLQAAGDFKQAYLHQPARQHA